MGVSRLFWRGYFWLLAKLPRYDRILAMFIGAGQRAQELEQENEHSGRIDCHWNL